LHLLARQHLQTHRSKTANITKDVITSSHCDILAMCWEVIFTCAANHQNGDWEFACLSFSCSLLHRHSSTYLTLLQPYFPRSSFPLRWHQAQSWVKQLLLKLNSCS